MNANSFIGYDSLPKYILTDTNEHALIVPTAGTTPAGSSWSFPYYMSAFPSLGSIYPGFPSPVLPVNSGLSFSFPPDILGSGAVDGHPFKVKISCVVANPGGGNLNVRLYQVPFANIGTISATGSVTTAGAPGSGDNVASNIALTTPANPSHFWIEYILNWDSSTNRLDGYSIGQHQATSLAQTTLSNPLSSGVTAVNALNFLFSFQFATGNAGNSVTVQEAGIERY